MFYQIVICHNCLMKKMYLYEELSWCHLFREMLLHVLLVLLLLVLVEHLSTDRAVKHLAHCAIPGTLVT